MDEDGGGRRDGMGGGYYIEENLQSGDSCSSAHLGIPENEEKKS